MALWEIEERIKQGIREEQKSTFRKEQFEDMKISLQKDKTRKLDSKKGNKGRGNLVWFGGVVQPD